MQTMLTTPLPNITLKVTGESQSHSVTTRMSPKMLTGFGPE